MAASSPTPTATPTPRASLTSEGRTRLAQALGQQGQTVQVAKVHFYDATGTKVHENTPAMVGHDGDHVVVVAATLETSLGDFTFTNLAFYSGDPTPVRLLNVSVQPFSKQAGGLAFAQLVRIEYTDASQALGSTQPAPPWLLTGDNAFAHVQALHTRTLHPYDSSATAIDVQAGLGVDGDVDCKNHALLNASINATLINSGVLETERIPSLDAGKITAGVLDVLRIPALAAGKIATGVLDLLRIPRISPQAAEVIKEHHYSGKVVVTSSPNFGVWIGGDMLGVLQFGPLANPRCFAHIVADSLFEECRELNRMWLSDRAPRNSESRAISLCMRLMKRTRPALKWVQSFADERCGRWGVVYQASNFLYLGEHKTTFYEIYGEMFHNKSLTIKGNRGWKLLQQGKRAKSFSYRQFRYLYPVDKRIVPRIRFPILPYPKPENGH